jgi:ribonuclease P protein component
VIFRVPNDLGHFRLGITLKARGSSIERNRVKRQIRESFRTQAAILGSYDYNVVISGSKKMAHPFHLKLGACLRQELARGLAQAR